MGDLLGGGWIKDLPEPTQAAVRARMRPRDLIDGERLFAQGDEPDALYEIVSGQIMVVHHTTNGVESIITIFGAGDCVGEQSLIDQQPRANSAFSRGRTKLLVLPRSDFSRLRCEHPDITEALLQLISKRFRLVLARLNEEGGVGLKQRLARRIFSLAEPYVADGGNVLELNVRLSQSDFARWVGFSRQRVNIVLGELQRDGLLIVSQDKIKINDVARLRRFSRSA